jgi:hypothetical protein
MGRERYTPQQQEFYKRYLNSPRWRMKKDARIARAGGQCEFQTTYMVAGLGEQQVRCYRTRYLCVHHNTYERLGDERDSDLDVFCWLHHMLEHLLWKTCNVCGQPCLGYDALGEQWLEATLAQMGIDLDAGRVDWRGLPTKEQLAAQIHPRCMRCRGIQLTKDDA